MKKAHKLLALSPASAELLKRVKPVSRTSVLYPLQTRSWVNPSCRVSDEGGFWRARLLLKTTAAVRAIKPTEVGDAAQPLNHDRTQVNKGWFQISGYPRRGDRCGDRVKALSQRGLSLKKSSSGVIQRHHLFLNLRQNFPPTPAASAKTRRHGCLKS